MTMATAATIKGVHTIQMTGNNIEIETEMLLCKVAQEIFDVGIKTTENVRKGFLDLDRTKYSIITLIIIEYLSVRSANIFRFGQDKVLNNCFNNNRIHIN